MTPTGELEEDVKPPDDVILQPCLKNSESLAILEGLVKHLSCKQCSELKSMLIEFSVLFSDTPSRTHLIEHDIDVGDAKPVRQHFYCVL